MNVLIVDDDPVALLALRRIVQRLGHEGATCEEGERAAAICQLRPPDVVISDWIMPGVDGLELCRRLRATTKADRYLYFVLLTAHTPSKANQEMAFAAGVDDFLVKPCDTDELRLRFHVAARILEFTSRVRKLEKLIPICAYCKRVREDSDYWQQIEDYMHTHAGADFTHSICPTCYEKHIRAELEKLKEGESTPAG
jgi:sigma-B regulation protein RsbU (phosphoserine phosphatase)